MLELRNLPFDPNSNAVVSKEACDYHHGKHHQTYVNNYNNLTKDSELANASLYDVRVSSQGGLFNNAAQVYNHDFYWDCIAKKAIKAVSLKQL